MQWVLDANEPSGMHSWLQYFPNGGRDVDVALLDSGISSTVVHMFDSILQGFDFISDPVISLDGDGRDSDWTDPGDTVPGKCDSSSWHGTQTGCLLACNSNKADTNVVLSASPNSRLIPVRVLGACKTGYASDVADAIVWAAGGNIRGMSARLDPIPKIIVMPFSGFSGSEWKCQSYLQSAVDIAVSNNITLLAAAGNNNGDDASRYFPGNCMGVMSVGALARDGEIAAYSNRQAQLYMPGGDFTNPLICMSFGLQLTACSGTSFSAVLAASWVASITAVKGAFVVPGMNNMPMLLNLSMHFSPDVFVYSHNMCGPDPDENGTNMSALQIGDGMNNRTVTGQATSVDCYGLYGGSRYPYSNARGTQFWQQNRNTGGSFQACGDNSCMWGIRPIIGIPAGDEANWKQPGGQWWYMDEFCTCEPGYQRLGSSFWNSPWGYSNGGQYDGARPNGYCYTEPAAHDQVSCAICDAGNYCPGGAYWSYYWPGKCEDSYYLMHYGQFVCSTCIPGKYVSAYGNCGDWGYRVYDRQCTDCTSGTDYSTTNNAGSCTACSSGSYSTSPGMHKAQTGFVLCTVLSGHIYVKCLFVQGERG
jgi:hypothetical protein